MGKKVCGTSLLASVLRERGSTVQQGGEGVGEGEGKSAAHRRWHQRCCSQSAVSHPPTLPHTPATFTAPAPPPRGSCWGRGPATNDNHAHASHTFSHSCHTYSALSASSGVLLGKGPSSGRHSSPGCLNASSALLLRSSSQSMGSK